MYDYLVVGSGLFGSVFAYEMAKRGYRIKVIEKRNHIGGNIYTHEVEGIQVHTYGAHIFHTKSKEIWDYVNQFAHFNNYVNSPIANYKGDIYNLPFNMNTFNKLWGVVTPEEAERKIQSQRKKMHLEGTPQNLEEQAISLIGVDVYKRLVKGYTEKQWGRKATELPAFIIRRLPVRFTYNNNYFDDPYQGIPIGGYTQIIQRMLNSDLIDVQLNKDFFDDKEDLMKSSRKVLFTGMIDKFFNYSLGELEYRSLRFETKIEDVQNYQGNAVVNYTDSETPYTRVIEHKHFDTSQLNLKKTVLTYEYPQAWHRNLDPYYPVNNYENKMLYKKYVDLAKSETPEILFGGRLGQYRYYNMDQTIMASQRLIKEELKRGNAR